MIELRYVDRNCETLSSDLLQEEMCLMLPDTHSRILGIPTLYKDTLNTRVICIQSGQTERNA